MWSLVWVGDYAQGVGMCAAAMVVPLPSRTDWMGGEGEGPGTKEVSGTLLGATLSLSCSS